MSIIATKTRTAKKRSPAGSPASIVMQRDVPALRKWLKSGGNPDWRNPSGEPLLHLAVYREKNARIVRTLLAAGATVDLPDRSGNTALMVCVRDADLTMVRELLRHKANVNAANRDGDTPLTNAACWGSVKVVKDLLRHGADPNLKDGAGVLPSHLARQQGHVDLSNILSKASSTNP